MNNETLKSLGFIGLFIFIIYFAGVNIYYFVDETLVYLEIKDGIIPKEPYDSIERIELFGQAKDGWHIANVFVVNSETNDFDNSMIRYNRDTKEFIIPSETLGFEACIELKPCN